MPLPIDRAGGDLAEPGELADVGVEREVRRARASEGVAEVARAAADVEHSRAARSA